jgi:Holliday junction resolvase YEN1
VYCSIWLYQTIAVYHNPHHVSSGANPELRTLFYKLAHLLKSCVVPVFVFDGPGRPAIKRNRLVRQNAHWLTEDLREMIDAFGFYSHQVSDDMPFP